jgi:hypothetical protein
MMLLKNVEVFVNYDILRSNFGIELEINFNTKTGNSATEDRATVYLKKS